MSDLARAVERLGQTLEAMGIPRMPARVFAFILADDQECYTAAELARGLDVSPAAISGAVRYLADTHLVVRERKPGGRGDLFRVRDGDIWGTILGARLSVLDRIVESVQEAAELLEPGSAGRERVAETQAYFTFVRQDALGVQERWQKWRASGSGSAGAAQRL